MKHTKPEGGFAAEQVLGRMKDVGIDVLFVNGGTDFPSIIEAYARRALSGVAMPAAEVIPHEGVAVGIAHGYYLICGKPAGVMVHVNVGLANSVMGLINARSDNVPILMCSGRTPLTEMGRFGSRSSPIHWGQEMRDQNGMVREIVKWDYELRYPEQAIPAIDRAVTIAMSEPRGPVYLSLPREALAEGSTGNTAQAISIAPSRFGPAAPDLVRAAADLLLAAERPVMIVQSPELGDDFGPLPDFAERLALPVVEYWPTRVALAASHPMHAGREPAPWLKDADVVIVASAMVPWIMDQITLPAGCKVIAIGPEPHYSHLPMRTFPADLVLAGGVNETIRALDAATGKRLPTAADARRKRVAQARVDREAAVDKRVAMGNGSPMSPAWVSRCVNEVMDERTTIFNELGLDLSVMHFEHPRSFFSTPLSGGLGWGMTAALGAQYADRSRQVIATIGDGSYMFANPVACQQTAKSLALPLLTIVFNNGIWNAVRRSTLYMYPDGSAASANVMPITGLEPTSNYAAIAQAHGAYAERVENGADLPAALQRALAATGRGEQALLEVMVSY
jgi:acetolactate synthase-1/2/3 large subunit